MACSNRGDYRLTYSKIQQKRSKEVLSADIFVHIPSCQFSLTD